MRKIVGFGFSMALPIAMIGCQSTGSENPFKASSRCVQVYSATTWRVHQILPGGILGRDQVYDKEDKSDMRSGAGIVVRAENRPFLVTASHVIGPAWVDGIAIAQKWQGRTSLTGGRVRIRVSSLAYAPLRLYVDPASDIAVLEMPPDFWEKLDVMSFQPKTELPAMEEVVKVWGFPQTSAPQLKAGPQVVRANVEMLQLNEPLDGGYSGGPVLDKNDNLIGMVLRTTERQSRAVPSARILKAIGDFGKNAVSYRDPMEIPPTSMDGH